jgi:hypothetical protein
MSDEIDVDQLMSEIEAPRGELFPMHDKPVDEAPTQETQQQAINELIFSARGQEIKVPYNDERVKQWASMGYDYAHNMAEFNKSKTQFDQERKAIEALKEQYGPVDEYVRQNPDFWQHILTSWQQRQQNADPNNPLIGEIQRLKEELQGVKQFKEEISQEREAQKIQGEDKALDEDIRSIQEKYKDLDWKSRDEHGKSLEYKVLEHAAKNKIGSFKTAFHDFYHEHLSKYETERAKETATKNIQAKSKAGLLGKSPTPQKAQIKATDVKGKSYDDLMKEALQEWSTG